MANIGHIHWHHPDFFTNDVERSSYLIEVWEHDSTRFFQMTRHAAIRSSEMPTLEAMRYYDKASDSNNPWYRWWMSADSSPVFEKIWKEYRDRIDRQGIANL